MSPRFSVVSCPGFLVVHVALLCQVRTLYPCDEQYPVGSQGGFSYVLGFATAGVPAVIFSMRLMRFRFCAWRLSMESVSFILAMKLFSNVLFFGLLHWLGCEGKQPFVFPSLFKSQCWLGD